MSKKRVICFPSLAADSASGIVCLQLAKALRQKDLDIVFLTGNSPTGLDVEKPLVIPYITHQKLWKKVVCVLLNRDPWGEIWARRARKRLLGIGQGESIKHFTVILSAGCFHLMSLAVLLKKTQDLSIHIHFLDAIPSPAHWGEHALWRGFQHSQLLRLRGMVNSYSAISGEMLEYQTNCFDGFGSDRVVMKKYVLPNPISKQSAALLPVRGDTYRILYFGNLSVNRRADAVINGFVIARARGLQAELIFQGSQIENFEKFSGINSFSNLPVFWAQRTNDIGGALGRADVLIDLDTPHLNDVFISGKLLVYLGSNKPIVCITPLGSPARTLFENRDLGIYFAAHEPEAIASAIFRACTENTASNLEARRAAMQAELSPENIASRLLRESS